MPTKSERGLDKNNEDRLHPLADPPGNTKSAIPEKELSPADREAQFQLLVNAVQDYAIFLLDPAGNVRTWNAGAKRIKRYTAAEIIGKHFSIFYPEEDKRNGKPPWELQVAKENDGSKMKVGVYEKMGLDFGRM